MIGADSVQYMDERLNIQWFPGHMTKARRMIEENIRQVDAVCEILDARIPFSSRIPDVETLTAGKPRIIVLNRVDQADPVSTKRWSAWYRARGCAVLETESKNGKGINAFAGAVRDLLKDKLAAWAEKAQTGRAIKIMVLGIPNVGKSSFINRVSGRRAAEASDRPGVTRGKQWVTVDRSLLLLDTPGILWPKFENKLVGENLAFCGSIKDDVVDTMALAANLLVRLRDLSPSGVQERLKFVPEADMTGLEMLEMASRKRGFLISGGEVDIERGAAVVLDEFRASRLGRVTLELPEA